MRVKGYYLCISALFFSLLFSACATKKVNILMPRDNSFIDYCNPVLEWDRPDVDEADINKIRYELMISSDQTFSDIYIHKPALLKNSYRIKKRLNPSKQYFWKVRAFNGFSNKNFADWSGKNVVKDGVTTYNPISFKVSKSSNCQNKSKDIATKIQIPKPSVILTDFTIDRPIRYRPINKIRGKKLIYFTYIDYTKNNLLLRNEIEKISTRS